MIKIYRKFFDENTVVRIEKTMRDLSGNGWSQSGAISSRDTKSSYDESRVAESITTSPDKMPQDIVDSVVNHINKEFGMNLMAHEPWSIQKYRDSVRGHFYWHSDVLNFFIYDADRDTSPERLFRINTIPHRKVSISVALNDRSDYNGGQFVIDMGDGKQTPVDLDRGDMIAFTSDTFHGVEDVTQGHRNALIIWLIDKEEYLEWEELCSDIDSESR